MDVRRAEGGRHPDTGLGVVGWMPPKIRELIADLVRAGFVNRGGKGSHRNFVHPKRRKTFTISGALGDDAKLYQVRKVVAAIKEVKS